MKLMRERVGGSGVVDEEREGERRKVCCAGGKRKSEMLSSRHTSRLS